MFPFVFFRDPYPMVSPGVTFQLVRDGRGLTWDVYRKGLDAWWRAKRISIISNPGIVPQRVLIGYSGLSTRLINLIHQGENLVDPTIPARWGYALYVADSIGLYVLSFFFRRCL
jgi:magnesium-dependent phosphatase 1